MSRRWAYLAVGLLLSAIASAGFFPTPKILKGRIENDVYHAPGDVLSVAVPFAKGTYEYTYLRIREQFYARSRLIVFGPAAYDESIYRVELMQRRDGVATQESFQEDAPQLMLGAMQMMEQDARAPVKETARDQEPVNGHPTLHVQGTQQVPAGLMANRPVRVSHEFFVMKFTTLIAVVIVMRPERRPSPTPGIPAARFASSLQVP